MNGTRATITYYVIVLMVWLIVTGRIEAGLTVIFGPKDKPVKTVVTSDNYPALPSIA